MITGSTKGIGFDVAQRFLKYGAKVIITGRKFLNQNKEKIINKNYVFYKADFGTLSGTKKLLNLLKKNYFPILLYNVGGNENLKDPLCNTDDWQKF